MSCEQCVLNSGSRISPSGNNNSPSIAFVGEAPGRNEAIRVGMAGTVLRNTLQHIGITEEECYFTNICMCRTPQNRALTKDEIANCFNRLKAELAEVKPRFVIQLGAASAKALSGKFSNMEKSHGIRHTNKLGYDSITTYHPAAILYPGGDTFFPFFLHDLQKVKRILDGIVNEYSIYPTQVIVINDTNAEAALKRMMEVDIISYDWETDGLNPRVNVGFCLGISWKQGTAVVFPVDMVRKYLPKLQKIFSRSDCKFIAFNGIFDAGFNKRIGLPPRMDDDPMHMHYMLDERKQRRSLEILSATFCDAPTYESDMLAEYKTNKNEFLQKIPQGVIYNYCGMDADYALRLFHIFDDRIKIYPRVNECYRDLIIPTAMMFVDVGQAGLHVDQERLAETTVRYEEQLNSSMAKLREITEDPDFNPRSNPQVAEILWDELEFDEPGIYKRKPRSVDKKTRKVLLERYPGQPFLEALDNYKRCYVTLSRYLWKIKEVLEPDGRIRCNWSLDRQETGRVSTTNPPLHQIPRDSDVRSVFTARPGYVLIQADYSQVEMRMAAHIAGDDKLTDVFRSGIDFHTKMAAEGFRVSYDKVTKERRQAAKVLSFGLLYLMGDKMLVEETKLPPKDAMAFIRAYKSLMPKVMEWVENIKQQVKSQRYVESVFGRRRRFPFITKDNLASLQREAVNFPIQSSASDLTLWNSVRIHKLLKRYYPEAFINMLWHDALYVEAPEGIGGAVARLVKNELSKTPFDTNVPFASEVKIGFRLGEGEIVD